MKRISNKKIILSQSITYIYNQICCFEEVDDVIQKVTKQIFSDLFYRVNENIVEKLMELIEKLVKNVFYSCREKRFRKGIDRISRSPIDNLFCQNCILGEREYKIGSQISFSEKNIRVYIFSNILPNQASLARINSSLKYSSLLEAINFIDLESKSLTGGGNVGLIISNEILSIFNCSPLEFIIDEKNNHSGFAFVIPYRNSKVNSTVLML